MIEPYRLFNVSQIMIITIECEYRLPRIHVFVKIQKDKLYFVGHIDSFLFLRPPSKIGLFRLVVYALHPRLLGPLALLTKRFKFFQKYFFFTGLNVYMKSNF